MNRPSAERLCETLIDRIATGAYPPGSKLPPARELAAETGVHRNTVVKAYNLLADLGLAAVRRGSGTYVSPEGANGARAFEASIGTEARRLALRAHQGGMNHQALMDVLSDEVRQVYASSQKTGVFIECNESDAHATVSELALLADVHLKPLILGAVSKNPTREVGSASVVCTSLFHLEEVRELLHSIENTIDLVGVHTEADEQALERIARIPSGSKVGVVVSNREGGRRFVAQIGTVSNVETRCLVEPTSLEIEQLSQWSDFLVCSRSQFARIESLQLGGAVIELPFHVSPNSAMRVKKALLSPDTKDSLEFDDSGTRSIGEDEPWEN